MSVLSDLLNKKPLRTWLAEKLVNDVVAAGGDPTKTAGVVQEVLSAKSIFEWLTTIDWAGLIQLILSLLAVLPKQ